MVAIALARPCCARASVRCGDYCTPCAAELFLQDHTRNRHLLAGFLLEYGRELDEVRGVTTYEQFIGALSKVVQGVTPR